ncbi:MAG: diguanylate cyclase [Alkalispirochaeta sp.]
MKNTSHTLIRDLMGKTVIVGLVAIAVTSVVAYTVSYRRRTQETLAVLQQSVTERIERETAIFDLARDNLDVFTEEFLRLYLSDDIIVTEADFERLYFVGDEGAHRMERQYFDGVESSDGTYRYGVSSFIGNNQAVDDPDLQRRLVLVYRLLAQIGPAFQTRFANTHVSYPENAITLFWPEVPWGLQARADLPMNELGVILATMQEQNPEREPVWTGLYFDETAEEWMITYQVPVDHEGRHLINPSHDVPLTDLMTRLPAPDSGRRPGYAFIMREDGYLVARPTLPAEDQRWVGQLSLEKIEDPAIVRSYEAIRDAVNENPAAFDDGGTLVLENTQDDTYLTVGRLDGPDWWYIDAFPMAEIQAVAHGAALERIFESVALLVILMGTFLVLVHRRAARPLAQLRTAAERMGEARVAEVVHGDVPLPVNLNNEIGLTAQRFHEMAGRILNANRELERVVDQRTQELQEANAALREMSVMDGLTGIHNRRSFDRGLLSLMKEVSAGGGTFSLIMIDLDFFKLYNDTYGHHAGDEVLRKVSAGVAAAIRGDDRVYRYGGEELAVLCPGTDARSGFATAQRIVEHIRSLDLSYPETEAGIVTASSGCAEFSRHSRSAEDVIQAADKQLYRAKQEGRNRAAAALSSS